MNFADRFYSVGELADLTGYHPDSIYRAIARGALEEPRVLLPDLALATDEQLLWAFA